MDRDEQRIQRLRNAVRAMEEEHARYLQQQRALWSVLLGLLPQLESYWLVRKVPDQGIHQCWLIKSARQEEDSILIEVGLMMTDRGDEAPNWVPESNSCEARRINLDEFTVESVHPDRCTAYLLCPRAGEHLRIVPRV